ncbi:MAG: DUF1932 domain-containing protein [Actinobacteria bacterium]|nr:DUF1932 domain-containing protein [Actinomycetota bacterium]
MTLILVLHPGAMGSSVAAALATNHEVAYCSAERSEATFERAAKLGLREFYTLDRAVGAAEVLISICPPAAAVDVALQAGAHGFDGVYVDANAIAAATAHDVQAAVPAASFVDGGIVGPPGWTTGTTRLYLSGESTQTVVALFGGTPIEAITVGEEVGQASALKMAYAGWTKGSSALLLAIAAYAKHAGVADALMAEWGRSLPGLEERLYQTAVGTSPKAWRFVGEMDEIAKSLAAAGLPSSFHEAAAAVYAKMAERPLVLGGPADEVDDHVFCRAAIEQLLS